MSHTPLLCFACGLLIAAGVPVIADAASQQVHYRGQLVQQDVGGGETPVRSFGVAAWIDDDKAIWRVDDEGRGGLPWWDSVGRHDSNDSASPAPRLRHVHLGRPYTLTLPGPLVSLGPFELDAMFEGQWEGRRTTFTVTGQQRVNNRDCWVLSADSGNGRRQTWLVEQGTGLLVRAASRVFIGQGERFELQLELDSDDPPAADTAAKELAATEQLLKLRDSLELLPDIAIEDLSTQQLAQVEAALDSLSSVAEETEAEHFVAAISAVTQASRQRSHALQQLEHKIVGQPLPNKSLPGVNDDTIPLRTPSAGITVLHFWEYRGKPEAPFGQVGYLDFLSGKLQGQPVRVIGVAVDERAADPRQLRAVRRDIKKFTSEFIRISYPLAIDDGSLVKTLGDPRPLETPFPLWVVVGKDGRIAHYRTGLYNVDPSRGLTELSQIIAELNAAAK
ncbi:MAG: TlpA family protein disulfide reductase [Planctomycetaceae bacterium]